MTTTPARVLRSRASTPATGGSVTTRASRHKDQPSSTNKDNDDGEDEPLLQTQLPITTQQEREDEDNDDDDNDDDEDDEEYEDENVKDTKPRQGPGSSTLKRTARKTVSHGAGRRVTPQRKSGTLVIEDNEEDEEEEEEEEEAAPEIPVKPEDSEVIESSGTEVDPNVTAKLQIDQYYTDILDYEQDRILFYRSERITRWPTLQHFWSSYPYKEHEYGRLYVRTRLCSLLVDGSSEGGYSGTSLVAWEATDWQDFIDDLRTTKDACLNSKCSHRFGFDPEEIPEIDRNERLKESRERASSKIFTQKYAIVEKTCQMNLLLAPIRQTLEEQIRSDATGPPTSISEADVKSLHAAASNCDSFVVRKHVFGLFVPADDTAPAPTGIDAEDDEYSDGAPPKSVLKNLEDLKEVLRTKPFDLLWLQGRIDQIVWKWNEECFGSTKPYLEDIGYHDMAQQDSNNRTARNRRVHMGAAQGPPGPKTPPARDKGERTDVLETLKRRRDALNKNHGDDPLSESRKLAASTKPHSKTTSDVVPGKNVLYRGKKSNIVVQFDDSEDEDDDDDKEGDAGGSESRVRLPRLPKKRRIMKSPAATKEGASSGGSKIYTGPPPDEGIFDANGNVLQRHPWEDEEILALVSGIEKYGLGKWVHIKQEYGYILRNRTTVQLKDKYRNMKKNGELPDRLAAVEV